MQIILRHSQCISTGDISENPLIISERITIKNNSITNSWGEGIDVILTTDCIVTGNRIRNCYAVFIYVDNAKHVTIEKNEMRQTNQTMEGCKEKTHGIALGNEDWPINKVPVTNINIRNNFEYGAMNGVCYWGETEIDYYSDVSVTHNTFWNLYGCGLQFNRQCVPGDKTFNNEFKNNLFYVLSYYFSALINENFINEWQVSGNAYYGIDRVYVQDTWNGTNGNGFSVAYPFNNQTSPYTFFQGGFYGNCSNEMYTKSKNVVTRQI